MTIQYSSCSNNKTLENWIAGTWVAYILCGIQAAAELSIYNTVLPPPPNEYILVLLQCIYYGKTGKSKIVYLCKENYSHLYTLLKQSS
jgi:hypothetical protein